jgi:phosphoribosyl 1,2-cyclic phosphate phosphodiesterase
MELLLLGTAAAECWPAPFCACDACLEAGRRGGPNIRTRSGALIDNELKIDFGPDTLMQLHRSRRNLRAVRTILFTHQHSDHFVPSELEWAHHPFSLTPPAKGSIELWGNSQVLSAIRREFNEDQLLRMPYVLRQFAAGDHFTTAAGEEVWAMPADHVAGACTLRIRRNGQTIFYGHDSGTYPAATLDRLSDGIALDVALLDCTNGGLSGHNSGHLCAQGVVQMVDELRKRKAITDRTRIFATHFSHGGKWLHEELVRYFLPHGIRVAYDGLTVNV